MVAPPRENRIFTPSFDSTLRALIFNHMSRSRFFVGYDLSPVDFTPDLEKTTDFAGRGCFEDPKCDRSDSPRVYANVASNHEIIPVNRAGNWYFRFRGCMYSDVSKSGKNTCARQLGPTQRYEQIPFTSPEIIELVDDYRALKHSYLGLGARIYESLGQIRGELSNCSESQEAQSYLGLLRSGAPGFSNWLWYDKTLADVLQSSKGQEDLGLRLTKKSYSITTLVSEMQKQEATISANNPLQKSAPTNSSAPSVALPEKYAKMKKVGLPDEVIKNSMQRDGLDPNTYFQTQAQVPETPTLPQKYARMKKVGLPDEVIKNSMQRDGLDPNTYFETKAQVPVVPGISSTRAALLDQSGKLRRRLRSILAGTVLRPSK